MRCDNQSAIALANNPAQHRSTKHIVIRYHFIREMESSGGITVECVETAKQTADIFTKGLNEPSHSYLAKSLGLPQSTDGALLMIALAPAESKGEVLQWRRERTLEGGLPKRQPTRKPTLQGRMVNIVVKKGTKPTLVERMGRVKNDHTSVYTQEPAEDPAGKANSVATQNE